MKLQNKKGCRLVRLALSHKAEGTCTQTILIPLSLLGEQKDTLRDDLIDDFRLTAIVQLAQNLVVGGAEDMHRLRLKGCVFQKLASGHFGPPTNATVPAAL